jgi:hypothetical protein
LFTREGGNQCHDPETGEFCETGGSGGDGSDSGSSGGRVAVDPTKPIDPSTSKNITPKEKTTINKYQSKGGFKKINNPLREGAAPSDDAKNLSSAIAKHTIDKEITVYRGMGNTVSKQLVAAWENKKAGEDVVFKEKGFLSTSRSRGAASTFSDQMFVLKLPKGSSALPMAAPKGMGGEAEILLNRETKFKVVGMKPGVTKGSRLFEVELA